MLIGVETLAANKREAKCRLVTRGRGRSFCLSPGHGSILNLNASHTSYFYILTRRIRIIIRIRIDISVVSGIPPDISTVFEHTMGVAPVSVRIFLLCFLSSLSSQGSSAPIQSSVTGSLSPSLNGFVLVHG